MAKLKALLGCNSKTLVEKYGFTEALPSPAWSHYCGCRLTFRQWSGPSPARFLHRRPTS